MKSHLYLAILLSLTLTSVANAEIYKGRCQIENARTHNMAQKVIELEFVNNGQFAQKKLTVSSNVGDLGKVTLSAQFTVAVLDSVPQLNISTDLKVPQYKMSIADMNTKDLGDSRGDVMNVGSMLTLDKEVLNYGCVISVK